MYTTQTPCSYGLRGIRRNPHPQNSVHITATSLMLTSVAATTIAAF